MGNWSCRLKAVLMPDVCVLLEMMLVCVAAGRALTEREKVSAQIISNWFANKRKELKKLAREGEAHFLQYYLFKVALVFGRPFVKRFALCYRSVVLSVCLSVLSVCL